MYIQYFTSQGKITFTCNLTKLTLLLESTLYILMKSISYAVFWGLYFFLTR